MSERSLRELSDSQYGSVDRALVRMGELVDAAINAFARDESAVLLAHLEGIESRVRHIRDLLTEDDR